MPVSRESFGLNEPDPSVDHCPLEAPPPTTPFRRTSELLEQTTTGTPALTIGASVIISSKVSRTAVHNPLLVVVRIISIDPFNVSASLGVYIAARSELLGLNPPVPVDDQIPVVVPLNTRPFNP